MIKIKFNEDFEIITALCLLSQNDFLINQFRVYEFVYIPNLLKKEILFFEKNKISTTFIKLIEKKGLTKVFTNKQFLAQLTEFKNSIIWKKWWSSWEIERNNIKIFLETKLKDLENLIETKYDIEIYIPFFYKKQLIKKDKAQISIISNLGFSFDEYLLNVANENNKTFLSEIYLNILLLINNLDSKKYGHDWKEFSITKFNSELTLLDTFLAKKINWYNFNIENNNPKYEENYKKNYLYTFKNTLPSEIKEQLIHNEIFIIGEQHCISEQETFLCNFLNDLYDLNYRTICLEIPSKFQKFIDSYLEAENEILSENIYMMRNLISFVKEFNKHNKQINIYCIDYDTSLITKNDDFIKRENILTKNFKEVFTNTDNKIIGIFGNFHAQKNKVFYLYRNDNIIPLAQNLAKKHSVFSINTFGLKGEEKLDPFPCRIRYRFNNQNLKYIKTPLKQIIKNNQNGFLIYKKNKKQIIYLDSATYKYIKKSDVIVFDASLVFPIQTVAEWSKIYEK